MVKVLVVEDDPAARTSLERALRLENYDVASADGGFRALEVQRSAAADVVLLDLQLPDIDGLEVCRRLRQAGDATPVLMVTARDAVDDRVVGLDAGADDYVVKPYALDELLARIRALLRRREDEVAAEGILEFAHLRMDPVAMEVHSGDRLLELTRTEYSLLELFLRHPRQVLTRSVIFEAVWDYDFGPRSNSLEVYVGYLRRKSEAGGEPRVIQTVRGVGYVLREQ